MNDENKFKPLELELLRPSNDNPRPADEAKSLDLLALRDSIKLTGLKVPILVRPHPTQANRYEIVDGARRYMAVTALGMKTVTCDVQELTDEEAAIIRTTLNLQRKNIHPLDHATELQGLAKKFKLTREQIASRLGKPLHYVVERMSLSNLMEEAQRSYRAGALQLEHATLLARYPEELQKAGLKFLHVSQAEEDVNDDGSTTWKESQKTVVTKHVTRSAKELQSFFEQAIHLPLMSAPFDVTDATLNKSMGACGPCKYNSSQQADLFGGASGKSAICLLPRCYRQKIRAHGERLVEYAKKDGKPFFLASDDQRRAKDGILGRSDHTEYGYGHQSAKKYPVFMIDGLDMGKTVQQYVERQFDPAPAKKEKTAGSTGKPAKPTLAHQRELKKRRDEIFQTKIDQETRRRAFTHCVAMTERLKPKMLEAVVLTMIDHVNASSYAHEILNPLFGLARGDGFGTRGKLKKLAVKSEQAAAQIAVALTLQEELIAFHTDPAGDDDGFKLCAGELKLDLPALRKKVAAEMEAAKQKKKSAAGPAKKSTPRKGR